MYSPPVEIKAYVRERCTGGGESSDRGTPGRGGYLREKERREKRGRRGRSGRVKKRKEVGGNVGKENHMSARGTVTIMHRGKTWGRF